MKTENHSISNVLTMNTTSFYIPPFQRAYAWGKQEITRYFNDILEIIDSELNASHIDKKEHFFGTLVIRPEKDGFATKSVIVDGQQRLTTTLLFLIALRDLEKNEASKDLINSNYLTNNSSTFQDKIKLKQVTKDWDAYKALVKNEDIIQGMIANAYNIFKKLIIDTKQEKPQITFTHYVIAIQRMNVAVIFLDERPFKGEDPQIIFETLNSLGKPLSLSDLIRNFVLLNMNSINQSEIYEETWHPKIENVLGEYTSLFFRDYLQYKTKSPLKVVSDNNTKELYQLFKSYVNYNFTIHWDFIKDIVRYVEWYKWIITEEVSDKISTDEYKNKEMIELIRNIFHDIKAEAFKPFVLGLFECYKDGLDGIKMSDDLFISILKTIRTYLIRRRILGLTQGENKNIVLLCHDLINLSTGHTAMAHLLSSMFYRMRFPNDDEIKDKLLEFDLYNELKSYSKFILGKIEENNSKVAVNFRNPKITIEHIMPQSLNKIWQDELGYDVENIHKKYLHNIGNLILTEFNSEMGNKSFEEKKRKLHTSSLYYRLDITENSRWNEESIKEHQSKMINWFLETFPLPEAFRSSSNWNTNVTNEKESISPMNSDIVDIITSNKPQELRVFDSIFKVKTWQDVFINFIDFTRKSDLFDFEFILDNQEELFGRNTTIIKWIHLKPLIDEGITEKNRYKSLQGLTFDKVINLSNDVLFIHVNISARDCMTRIERIMEKFNLSENDVEIKLMK